MRPGFVLLKHLWTLWENMLPLKYAISIIIYANIYIDNTFMQVTFTFSPLALTSDKHLDRLRPQNMFPLYFGPRTDVWLLFFPD